MKYLFAILISLLSVTSISSAIRNYPMGCLDEQPTCLSSGMVPHSNHGLGFISGFNQNASSVILSQLGISYQSLLDLPVTSEMFCSAVHDQNTQLGTCTVFALASAIESLLSGRNISRSELYLRVKTKGRSSLNSEGCCLREYIPLLHEGVLPWENFASYDALVSYLKLRKESNLRLIYSQDYRETIEDLKDHCQKRAILIPSDFHPRWTEEDYQARVDDGTPIAARAFCWINPFYWGVRAISDTPSHSFDKIVTKTRHKMEQMPYLKERFNMISLNVSWVGLKTIKAIISHKIPVVVSFAVFKAPHLPKNMWSELFLAGKDLIDLPTENAQPLPMSHAVCLCGYDNRIQTKSGKGAFRLKNSWSEEWGDKGYAWVSYEYFLQHTKSVYAITIK